MSTSRQKPSKLGPWQRLRWRWKLTVAGILRARWNAACAAPAAWVAFRGGYMMPHGYIYAASVAVVMVLAPVGMYLMGIRDEEGLR